MKKNDPNSFKRIQSLDKSNDEESDLKNYKLSDKQEKIIANKLADEHASDTIPSNIINEKGEVTGSYSTYENFGLQA